MKIAFVTTPLWFNEVPPLGIAYLISAVRAAGHEATVFDFNITAWKRLKGIFLKDGSPAWNYNNWNYYCEYELYKDSILPHLQNDIENVAVEICNGNPDVIGFSMQFTSHCTARLIAIRCKEKLPNVKVVYGGPSMSAANIELVSSELRVGCTDVAVLGEGEATLVELLQRWSTGQSLHGCKGIVHKSVDGAIIQEPPREPLRISEIARPTFDDFPLADYANPRAMPLIISRGCIAKCTFCSETRFWLKYRYRTAEDIFSEMCDLMDRYNCNYFYLNDSLINGNIEVLSNLVDRIIASGRKFQWCGFARIDRRMTKDLLARMAKAGCHYMRYGFESGSQKIVDLMEKRATVNLARTVLCDTHEAGIKNKVQVLVGFPGETEEDFEETMRFLRENLNYLYEILVNEMFISYGLPVSDDPTRFGVSTKVPYIGYDWVSEDGTNTPAVRRARYEKVVSLARWLWQMNNVNPNLQEMNLSGSWIEKPLGII